MRVPGYLPGFTQSSHRVDKTGGVYRECTEGGPVEERPPTIPGREDGEVARALDRLRLNFYHLWLVLEELRASDDPDALLLEWREAPQGSQGWRKALFYDDALEVLRVALCSR